MKQCKHCGSHYRPAKGRGEFCCAGCEHVYAMIQENGLGDYYVRQDRAGQPVGDGPFGGIDNAAINQLQQQSETASGGKVILSVGGMSCMGCAWLVEQLARRHRGVLFAGVALDSNRLSLEWKTGDFDLCELAGELQKFGYKLGGASDYAGCAVSPLGMRLGLTLIFSLNGLLLLFSKAAGIGGAPLQQLYVLLLIVCLLFSQLIGGALFLKPAWRGLQLRRLHSDGLPALVLLVLFVSAIASLLIADAWTLFALLYFLLLPSMVFARWLLEIRVLKQRG